MHTSVFVWPEYCLILNEPGDRLPSYCKIVLSSWQDIPPVFINIKIKSGQTFSFSFLGMAKYFYL